MGKAYQDLIKADKEAARVRMDMAEDRVNRRFMRNVNSVRGLSL